MVGVFYAEIQRVVACTVSLFSHNDGGSAAARDRSDAVLRGGSENNLCVTEYDRKLSQVLALVRRQQTLCPLRHQKRLTFEEVLPGAYTCTDPSGYY